MEQVKTSAELKVEAKSLLRGRWADAVKLNLVPTLLTIAAILVLAFTTAIIGYLGYHLFHSSGSFESGGWASWSSSSDITYNAGINSGHGFGGGIFGIFTGLFTIGINYTFLDWLRNPKRKIEPFRDAFQVFSNKYFFAILVLEVIIYVFVGLWSLLLVIPGIIKSIAYSQTYFIYKDISDSAIGNEMRFTDYITESRILMDGHKGRYFILQLSFIGWHILAWFTFGIGYLWLNPYIRATEAAFYKDLAKDKYLVVSENHDHIIGD